MTTRYCQECQWVLPRHNDGCAAAEMADPPSELAAPPPVVRTEAERQVGAALPDEFVSPAGLGNFAFLGLLFVLLATAFSLYTDIAYRSLIGELLDGTYDGSLQNAIDTENAFFFSGTLSLFALPVLGITWLFWMRRLRANVVALGRTPEHRPAWIFWGWIVPIMNYFRPYQIIRDLWQKSDPRPGTRGTTASVPATYNAWWASLLISNQIGRVVLRTQETDTIEQAQSFAMWALVVDVMAIPALVFAAIVIRTLTARQITAGEALGRHIAHGR